MANHKHVPGGKNHNPDSTCEICAVCREEIFHDAMGWCTEAEIEAFARDLRKTTAPPAKPVRKGSAEPKA